MMSSSVDNENYVQLELQGLVPIIDKRKGLQDRTTLLQILSLNIPLPSFFKFTIYDDA